MDKLSWIQFAGLYSNNCLILIVTKGAIVPLKVALFIRPHSISPLGKPRWKKGLFSLGAAHVGILVMEVERTESQVNHKVGRYNYFTHVLATMVLKVAVNSARNVWMRTVGSTYLKYCQIDVYEYALIWQPSRKICNSKQEHPTLLNIPSVMWIKLMEAIKQSEGRFVAELGIDLQDEHFLCYRLKAHLFTNFLWSVQFSGLMNFKRKPRHRRNCV